MSISAIQNVSFASKKSKQNVENKENKSDRYFKWVSQNQANDALKLSVGREVEDGKYKATSAFAALGAWAVGAGALFKGFKTLDLMKEARLLSAQSVIDIGQLGKIDAQIMKNIKVTKAAIIAVPVLLAIASLANNLNARKAEKTANERGFYTMNDRYKMKTTEEVYSKANEVYERFTAGQSAEK